MTGKEIMEYSSSESNRFKMRVFRGVLENIVAQEIQDFILEHQVDIAIIRIPCDKLSQLYKVDRLGFPFLVADTLVYYYVDLTKYEPQILKNNNLQFIKYEACHHEILCNLVQAIFSSYTSHYDSNPVLPKEEILEGYKEWASSYLESMDDEKIAWLIQQNGKYVGFATCGYRENIHEAEGVLFGVLPEASGAGLYSDIIRFTQGYFKKMGFSFMKVSTQIHNFAVQKVWSREGFMLKKAYNTIHINSLFNYSQVTLQTFALTISQEDVNKYGLTSGDYNQIHFNDEYAVGRGLEKRIAHGLIINAISSKYFGMEYPGNGTLFIGYSYKFLKPLYLNNEYLVSISFPKEDTIKGIYRSLVIVKDSNGEVCLFSYNDLLKR